MRYILTFWERISVTRTLFLAIFISTFSAFSVDATETHGAAELSLEKCIQLALERNLNLAQEMVKISNRNEEIREVKGTAFPQLSVESGYTYIGNITKIDFGEGQKISLVPEDNYIVKFMVTQLLYTGGQVRSALRLAEAAKESVEMEDKLTREGIIMMVSIYYYNCLLTDKMVLVAGETVETVRAHLNNVRKMKEQELVSEFDLLRAEVELANVEPLLIRSRNQREISFARLADIIQWDGGKFTLIDDFDQHYAEFDRESINAIAEDNRFEIKLLLANKKVLQEATNIEKGTYKPTILAFGNYDWANDELDIMTGDTTWNYGWNVGLQMSWTLFDGFQRQARVAKSQGELKILSLEKEKLLNSIHLELTEAVNNYQEALDLINSQKINVTQARRGLELAKVRYNQGISTQLEVLDSQTALTRAQSEYVSALHAFSLAKISLKKAMGILYKEWQDSNGLPGNVRDVENNGPENGDLPEQTERETGEEFHSKELSSHRHNFRNLTTIDGLSTPEIRS